MFKFKVTKKGLPTASAIAARTTIDAIAAVTEIATIQFGQIDIAAIATAAIPISTATAAIIPPESFFARSALDVSITFPLRSQNLVRFPTSGKSLARHHDPSSQSRRLNLVLDVFGTRQIPVQDSMGAGKTFMRRKMALVSPDRSNGNAIEDGEKSTHLGIVGGLHG